MSPRRHCAKERSSVQDSMQLRRESSKMPVLKMRCSHSIWGEYHRQRFKDSAANCTTDYFCQEWGEAEKTHLVNGGYLA